MKKYEHRIESSLNVQSMDRIGKEGWELSGVAWSKEYLFYFKREVKTKEKAKKSIDPWTYIKIGRAKP